MAHVINKRLKKKKHFQWSMAKQGSCREHYASLLTDCDCSWMWGSKTETIASEVTKGCSTIQIDRWTITGHLAVLLELL